MTKKCDICECPDDDHYDWCSAGISSRSSKELNPGAIAAALDDYARWFRLHDHNGRANEMEKFSAALRTAPEPQPAASKEQNTEALAWALQAHEDLATMLADGGGNMLHVRANRALAILFAEVERLEKIAYPIGAAHEPPAGPPWSFDRYRQGRLMAEGITIERETTFEAAAAKAACMSHGLDVLVLRPAQPRATEPPAAPAAWQRVVDSAYEPGPRMQFSDSKNRPMGDSWEPLYTRPAPPPGANVNHLRYDVRGWVCSICHGFNAHDGVVCRYPHSASTKRNEP